MIQSAIFSLSELEITQTGYGLKYVGTENFRYVFRIHPTFVRELTETIIAMVTSVFGFWFPSLQL